MAESARDRAIALIAPHCDIIERLNDVPPSARVRGWYFKSVMNLLRRHDRLAAFASYFPDARRSSLTFYPLGDYLVRLAVAGAMVTSPERLHDGIFEIARQNAASFASSLLGRVMLRVLDRDPVRLTQQGLAARRQSTTYGEWSIRRPGPTEIEMVYRGEYMWIESAVGGAAAGTFEMCGVKAQIETVLTDRYNGSTLVRW
ncbi:MAG TPA: TIGR02265 family protein [Polyangia bacterium]